MVDHLLASIGKLFFGLALIYIILKIINKRRGFPTDSFFDNRKTLLYQLHVNGSKVTLILGLIHGLMNLDTDIVAAISGWSLTVILVALTGSGAILSVKHHATPMSPEDDEQWRSVRIIKWILAICAVLLLALHTLYYQVIP